jgi:hypothetical protein
MTAPAPVDQLQVRVLLGDVPIVDGIVQVEEASAFLALAPGGMNRSCVVEVLPVGGVEW